MSETSPRNDLHILNYRLVDSASVERPTYFYMVDVQVGRHHHYVEKRYSHFHRLHRQLRKQFQTPPFPPKRVRCSQPHLLEKRRQELEIYLRTLFQESSTCQSLIMDFLGLPSHLHQIDESLGGVSMDHQPIYVFRNDPYIQTEKASDFPNVVVNGMLKGLYDVPPGLP